MNFLRKFISCIILILSLAIFVAVCCSSSMNTVWHAFKEAFSPFNFTKLADAAKLFMNEVGMPLVLMLVGFIGLTMPKSRH